MINMDGTPWKQESVNLMFADIREKAIEDLRERDVTRTDGACGPDNGFQVGSFPKTDAHGDTTGQYALNPMLQQQRHTGREGRLLTFSRWHQYRLVPRDETTEVGPLRKALAEQECSRHVDLASGIEESLADPKPVTTLPVDRELAAAEAADTTPKTRRRSGPRGGRRGA